MHVRPGANRAVQSKRWPGERHIFVNEWYVLGIRLSAAAAVASKTEVRLAAPKPDEKMAHSAA